MDKEIRCYPCAQAGMNVEAVAIYYLDEGCQALDETIQPLCIQHEGTITPVNHMVHIVDLPGAIGWEKVRG